MKKLLRKLGRFVTQPVYRWPSIVLTRLTRPIPPALWLSNLFWQRVVGLNRQVPWMVHFTSQVIGDVQIGHDVWCSFALSGGCYIQGINGVRIGDGTIFAPGVKIISANHDPKFFERSEVAPPLVIGRHCWLGANVVVLPGVVLGDNVIVGAGAVVTKSFPGNTVLAGVPARVISRLAPSCADVPKTIPRMIA